MAIFELKKSDFFKTRLLFGWVKISYFLGKNTIFTNFYRLAMFEKEQWPSLKHCEVTAKKGGEHLGFKDLLEIMPVWYMFRVLALIGLDTEF